MWIFPETESFFSRYPASWPQGAITAWGKEAQSTIKVLENTYKTKRLELFGII